MKRNVSAKRKDSIFWRDGGVCRVCKEDVREYAWDIDHILALCDGGTNEDSNLQLLCCNCHAVKTRTENIERAEKNRESVKLKPVMEELHLNLERVMKCDLEQYRYVP